MLISISVLNASKYMRERSRHACDKIFFNMYFIFYISYHATLEEEKMSVLHVRTIFIAYTISYVQISYVHLYAQLTIGRTYFSGILFFFDIY